MKILAKFTLPVLLAVILSVVLFLLVLHLVYGEPWWPFWPGDD